MTLRWLTGQLQATCDSVSGWTEHYGQRHWTLPDSYDHVTALWVWVIERRRVGLAQKKACQYRKSWLTLTVDTYFLYSLRWHHRWCAGGRCLAPKIVRGVWGLVLGHRQGVMDATGVARSYWLQRSKSAIEQRLFISFVVHMTCKYSWVDKV